jgi:hypothetical protein
MLKIRHDSDGSIVELIAEDAHTLYVTAYLVSSKKPVRKEALTIPDLNFLDSLHQYRDPQDGMLCGQKWVITPLVIKELKSKGGTSQFIPGHPLRFEYQLRKVKHADNLKHRG